MNPNKTRKAYGKLDIAFLALLAVVVVFAYMIYAEDRYGANMPDINELQLASGITQAISQKYAESETEFAVCLYGTINGNTAHASTYYLPESTSTTKGITTGECRRYFEMGDANLLSEIAYAAKSMFGSGSTPLIGAVHSHPNGVCALSELDTYSFGYSRYPMLGVICGQNTIRMYTADNLKEGFVAK